MNTTPRPTPGRLIETMAGVLGLPENSVFLFDRGLAEAGLRGKSGRGNSAARVTAADAANLLLSILGAPITGPVIANAARTCRRFRDLVPVHDSESVVEFKRFGLSTFSTLPSQHTLSEALTCLIDSVAKGEKLDRWVSGQSPAEAQEQNLVLEVTAPRREASIMALNVGKGSPEAVSISYGEYNLSLATPEFLRTLPPLEPVGDLEQRRRITFETIAALAAVIERPSSIAT